MNILQDRFSEPPSRPAANRMRVAVIDSGVNPHHPHICARTRGIILGGEIGETWNDHLGHGTAVMAAIQEKAPEAEYTAIKLFHRSLRSNTARLFQALAVTIENRFNVVNLSLGTTNLESRLGFEAFIQGACRAGVVIVSAARMGDRVALPGSLPGVIGVDVDWSLPRNCYRVERHNGTMRFYASGYPRTLPGMTPERNLNGISFAVANMTGFVVRACMQLESVTYTSVCDVLSAGPEALNEFSTVVPKPELLPKENTRE